MKSFFIILTAFTVLAVAAPDAKLAEVSNLNEAARGIARAAAPEAVSNKVAMAEESEAFGGCGQCANSENGLLGQLPWLLLLLPRIVLKAP